VTSVAPTVVTFEGFYAERYRSAVRLAYVITGDATSAEDIAQEALARVEPRFAEVEAPWAYVRTTIVNVARTQHRRRQGEEARVRLATAATPATTDLVTSELLDAIDRLPFRQKAVIVLRYYEDLTERDIAEVLGCRPGTVKSLASRALARLAEEVER
jgi:RNA polymerase sigma-70 factor (sigma-E family)